MHITNTKECTAPQNTEGTMDSADVALHTQKSKHFLRDSASSFHWLSSSIFSCLLSRIGNISSHLHYMMFPSIQTIYFLWGYDPGNMSASNISSVAELSPVYCCLVIFLCHCGNWCRSFPSVDRPTQLIFIGLVFVSLSSADVNIQAQPVYDI